MDALDINVQLITNDNSGESKLIVTIADNSVGLHGHLTKDIFERLVPAKAYQLNIIHKISGNINSSGQMTINLLGQDRGAGNGQFVTAKTWFPDGAILVGTAGKLAPIRLVIKQSEDKRFN